MTMAEEQTELFKQLKDSSATPDGVVCEEEYRKANFKLLFVLKETNGTLKKGNLCTALFDGCFAAKTWDNVARWTEGILRIDEDIPWSELEQGTEARRKAYLKKLCAINIKKTPGGTTADNKEIYNGSDKYQTLLHDQLALYKPQIVICGGTGQAFLHACYPEKEKGFQWQSTTRGVLYAILDDALVFNYFHPAARVGSCVTYYALMDAVKEVRSLIPTCRF